jgi:tetratricopeptide (TPR) repeat protein
VVAGPLCLWILSQWEKTGGLAVPLAVLAALFILGYAASGWMGSQLALRMIPSLLHEAGIWERTGEMDKAEHAYQKALSLYDSFLVAPAKRRSGLPTVVARMARMYAAQTEKHETADGFLERYLEIDPSDTEIVQTWLQARAYHGGLTPQQQELGARIGDAHANNLTIQMTLARLYLRAKQTDFPALQVYRRVMTASEEKFAALAVDLSRVFLAEGRSDEWALPVYLQAARQDSSWEALRCGLAACLRWILPSERNAEWLSQARNIIGAVDDDTLVRMSSGFVPPSGSYRIESLPQSPAAFSGLPRLGRSWGALQTWGVHFTGSIGKRFTTIARTLRRSPRLRRGITWSLTSGLGILVIVFLINTVGYLTPSPAPEPPPALKPVETPPPPPMPYTLQVAAYLKPEHAERYLEELRKQSIDVYVVKAHSNDKTWYQVRIAHFPNKAEALTYGSTLKAKGLIEDFYVAKDQNP